MQAHLEGIHRALGPDSGLVLVGGAVRDLLLGRPGEDWDLASRLLPLEAKARLERAGFRVIPTGLQHGTLTVLSGPHGFELTTFRGDGTYSDGRRPDSIALGVDLEADLARRDFTVNALALPAEWVGHPDWRSHLVDPFDGLGDLAQRRLRAVGDPLLRFSEDGLRPLRACRFVAQLGFSLDPATREAIPLRLDVSRKVAVERVLVELTKLLTGAWAAQGLECLRESGLMGIWLPELSVPAPPMPVPDPGPWAETLASVSGVPPEAAPRWAALLRTWGDPGTAEGILSRLKASGSLTKAVLALLRYVGEDADPRWTDAAGRGFLKRLAEEGLDLEAWAAFREGCLPQDSAGTRLREGHRQVLAQLRTLAATCPALSVRQLALDGRALMRLAGKGGGPWLGRLQTQLLAAVLADPTLNTPEGLERLARSALQEHDGLGG